MKCYPVLGFLMVLLSTAPRSVVAQAGDQHATCSESGNEILDQGYANYYTMDSLEIAKRTFAQAQDTFLKYHCQAKWVEAGKCICGIHFVRQHYDEAIACWDSLLVLTDSLPQVGRMHEQTAYIYHSIGWAFLNKGAPDQALPYLENGLAIRQQLPVTNDNLLSQSHHAIGSSWLAKGNVQEARKHFEKNASLALKTEDYGARTRGYLRLAQCDAASEQYTSSLQLIELAEKEWELSEKPSKADLERKARIHLLKAQVLTKLGKAYGSPEVLGQMNQAYKFFTQAGFPRSDFFLVSEELARKSGDLVQALALVQYGLLDLTHTQQLTYSFSDPEIKNLSFLPQALELMARKVEVLQLLTDHQEQRAQLEGHTTALQIQIKITYQNALDLMDLLRSRDPTPQSRQTLNDRNRDLFSGAIAHALQLYRLTHDPEHIRDAFSYMERSKTHLLMSALQDRQARQFAGVPDSLLNAERTLKREIISLEAQLYRTTQSPLYKQLPAHSPTKTQSAKDSLRNQLLDKKYALRKLVNQVEWAYPDYHQLKYATPTADPAQLQAYLEEEDKVLLEYFEGSDSIFLIVLTSEKARLHTTVRDELFKQHLSNFRNHIANRNSTAEALLPSAVFLYKVLIHPVQDLIEGKDLVIIPDGELSYLSFEALVKSGQPEPSSFTQAPFLVYDHGIKYAYSARHLLQVQYQEPANDSPALRPFAGFASNYQQGAFQTEGQSLSELPHAVEEVTRIRELFGEGACFSDSLSETLIQEQFGSFAVVHFAMHSAISDSFPMHSAIAIPTGEGIERFEIGNIYNLESQAELVVLSVCESGTGKVKRGEGVISLASGFAYAGCPATVMSLWKVSDEQSCPLMTAFYEELLEGQAKDKALRNAKLSYLEDQDADETTFHPYYWAGLELQGSSRPLSMTDQENSSANYFLAIALIVLVAGLLWLRAKLRKAPSPGPA